MGFFWIILSVIGGESSLSESCASLAASLRTMVAPSISCLLKAVSSDFPGPAMGDVPSSSRSCSNPIAVGGGGGGLRSPVLVPPLSL